MAIHAKLKDKESIEALLGEMTLDEKLGLMSGGSIFRSAALEKYGIPSALLMDGGTGFNTMQMGMELAQRAGRAVYGEDVPGSWTKAHLNQDESFVRYYFWKNDSEKMSDREKQVFEKLEAMKADQMPDYDTVGCYPPGMLLGATWNRDVVYRCASALGMESSVRGVDVLLGSPNVNLHRDPRNGRLFEGYSEDPYLIKALAPEFVKGIQDAGVLANVKHYAANNQETWRMGVDEWILPRVLRELYLPGFEACIKDGNCRTVMSAYNKINGVACSQSKFLLEDVLRQEWQFDGMVLSDWNAVYDWREAIRAGNDLAMPGPLDIKDVKKDVLEGELSEADIDACVRNILSVLLEMPVMKGRKYTEIDTEKAMKAAYEAAAEGITLLKNDHALPLDKCRPVSFFGDHSHHLICCGEGSAEVVTNRNTQPMDCTAEKIGSQNVLFESVNEHTQAIVVVVSVTGQEGRDRKDLKLPPKACEELDKAIMLGKQWKKPVITLLNVVGPVEIMDYESDLDAILCAFLPGMGGGQALADILFGDVNPSGKLPLTFPRYYRDCPTYGNFPGEFERVNYGEGLYVGYRYYDKKAIAPLYAFGYGMSYTTFALTAVEAPEEINLELDETVPVRVTLKNTGAYKGKEVIQIYVQDVECYLDRPFKELKGFEKVMLDAGEEKTVEICLDRSAFEFYDTNLGRWIAEPGEFILHVGTSSKDISFSVPVNVHCRRPYALTSTTSIETLASDRRVMTLLCQVLPEMDVEDALKSIIIFNPDMCFEQFWKENVVRQLPELSGETLHMRYKQVCQGFKDINSYG